MDAFRKRPTRHWFERRPSVALMLVVLVAAAILIAAFELWASSRHEGLMPEQHAYLQVFDGPLYADVPHAGAIRDIWAGAPGTNSCGPDRLDIRYADYYLYTSAPFCHELLTIHERHGERATVNPPEADGEVWVFGGSTILDVGAIDADTIPSRLSAELNARIPDTVKVRNFGVTGFQSTQERTRFFEILRAEPVPPVAVVFYDGFNEAARSQASRPGGIPADLTIKVSALVEKRHGRSLRYAVGGFLSRFYAFNLLLRPALLRLRGAPSSATEGLPAEEIERRIDLGVENYLHNLRMVRAVARQYDIDAHFFLQPMVFTRPRPGPDEEPHLSDEWVAYWDPIFRTFYDRVRADERLADAPDFHDLTGVFDAETGNVFRDYGHLLPRGNAIVAEAMADILAGSAAFAGSPAAPSPE